MLLHRPSSYHEFLKAVEEEEKEREIPGITWQMLSHIVLLEKRLQEIVENKKTIEIHD